MWECILGITRIHLGLPKSCRVGMARSRRPIVCMQLRQGNLRQQPQLLRYVHTQTRARANQRGENISFCLLLPQLCHAVPSALCLLQ